MSTLQFDTWKNQAGTASYLPVTAKVTFDGAGVVLGNTSLNVSSITDNGTGQLTINFATAYTTQYYGVSAIGNDSGGGKIISTESPTATSLLIRVTRDTGVLIDSGITSVMIFGGG